MDRLRVTLLLAVTMAMGQTSASQTPSIALMHINVVDVRAGIVQPDRTVVIEGSRIVAIRPSTRKERLPSTTRVLNERGRFLIPGLWDMHVHTDGDRRMLQQFLSYGITSVRDVVVPIQTAGLLPTLLGSALPAAGAEALPVSDRFPSHPPELVREMVTVAHFDLKRVKELAESHPALAKAAWDWGFGDWESALGAASHMGNRPIAEYLISQGARPSLFSAAMLGQLDVVKALIAAQPGAQRIRGPHDISLLAHARMGGQAASPVLEFLQSLGDADDEPPAALSQAEAAALTGTYVFGVGINQQIEVNADMKMYRNKMYTYPPQLNWTRKGTMTRPLFHLGENTFYPAGGPTTRIRFTQESGAMVMAVRDGDFVLSARRRLEAK